MAAKTPSNGRVVLSCSAGDTFTPEANEQSSIAVLTEDVFQPQALIYAGATGASKGGFTDADGVTMCYLSVGSAGQTVTLDKHFWGGIRPIKGPITAFGSSGYLFIYI